MRAILPCLISLMALAAACSDDETTGTPPEGCIDYTTVDTNACGEQPCSFANDIMPIFQTACGLSTACHDSTAALPQEGLALAPPPSMTPTQMEIDAVHADIVDQPSVRSNLPLVDPGNPAGSWLLAKLEYADLTSCATNACEDTAKGCGVRMPQAGPKLEEERLAKIRAWIAAGAPNN